MSTLILSSNKSCRIIKLVLLFSLHVFIVIVSFDNLVLNNVDATNVSSESYRLSRRSSKNEDNIAQASKAYNSHPYGSNFAKLANKHESKYFLQEDPIKTAASHHHHKKGAKGWLDMGAWTKKKGAFGWYADFPVGKGR